MIGSDLKHIPNTRAKRIGWLITLAMATLGLALSLGIIPYQLDDAYITYRYAANVSQGSGPVFNPGGEPVEGFSSPLWLMLLSMGALIAGTRSLPLIGMGLGLTAFILCFLALFYRSQTKIGLADRDPIINPGNLVPAALLSVLPTAVFYAPTGMESLLFLLAVLVFFRAGNREIPLIWGLTAGFLSCWIRPEGTWFIPALAFLLLGRGELKTLFARTNLMLAGSVVLGNTVLTALRFLLFKSLLPNTYYAKAPWLKAGWLYLRETLSDGWTIILILTALLGIWLGTRRHRGYFLAGLSWLPAVVIEGGDWMPAGRLLLPAFGLFLLAGSGLFENQPGLKSPEVKTSNLRYGRFLAVIVLAAAILLNLMASLGFQKKARLSQSHSVFLESALADWVLKSGARSIGCIDIGIMGFLPRIEIVDFAGLTDRFIGRSPGHHLEKQFDLNYIFEKRKPDLILLRVIREPLIYPSGRISSQVKSKVENRIMGHPKFRNLYRFFFAMLPRRDSRPYYGKLVFGRNGFLPDKRAIPRDRVIYVLPK